MDLSHLRCKRGDTPSLSTAQGALTLWRAAWVRFRYFNEITLTYRQILVSVLRNTHLGRQRVVSEERNTHSDPQRVCWPYKTITRTPEGVLAPTKHPPRSPDGRPRREKHRLDSQRVLVMCAATVWGSDHLF